MDALVGRGERGITQEMLIVEAAVLKLGDVDPAGVEAGNMRTESVGRGAGRGRIKLVGKLVGVGDKRVLVVENTSRDVERGIESGRGRVNDATWNTFRSMIDQIDRPMDDARSLAMFGRVM